MCDYGRMPRGSYSVKRRSERTPVQIPVILVAESNGLERRGMTVDLSPEGMRLRSNSTLVPAQAVRLHLASYPSQCVEARVAWVGQPGSPEAGQAGFEFLVPNPKLVH